MKAEENCGGCLGARVFFIIVLLVFIVIFKNLVFHFIIEPQIQQEEISQAKKERKW
jgi:hypothetical protein